MKNPAQNNMKNNPFILFFLLSALIAGISSCSNAKYLPGNEALYTGADVSVVAPEMSKKKKKALTKELEALTRPRPNSSIFGLRAKLWFWNIGGEPKRKISVRKLIKKMGEPPVLASEVSIEKNTAILQNYQENNGYFRARTTGDTVLKSKRVKAVYTAYPGAQYIINKVSFQQDSSALLQNINRVSRRSLLKKGQPFSLQTVKDERDRIDARLKQRGFYYFNPENLLIDVDSSVGNSRVNLYVRVKPGTPDEAKHIYRINDIVVYPNYSLNTAGQDTSRKYGQQYSDYLVIDSSRFYKPTLFAQAMQFNKGDVYNRGEHNTSLNRLISLGIFKFVKNRFEAVGDSLLNTYYYLTPLPKKSLRIELGGNTKSNNLTGSQAVVGFTNRNTFRGGEILSVNATGGLEVQYSGQFKGYNTYRIGGEANLDIPRFLIPFIYLNPRGGFVPKTNVQLAYEVLSKQQLYTLNSFRGAFGYIWKETRTKEHRLYPVSIQYVQPVKVSQLYMDSLQNDPTLQKIIDKQFILGLTYNYLFNQMIGRTPDNGFYFNGLIDLSGNIAGLIKKGQVMKGDTARLFGSAFSQYAKIETDFRYYRKLGANSSWANRIIIGAGFPYGNSSEIPFIKQFFIGGNNSLRAFRSRSIGPGTYLAKGFGATGFIPDQSGDIKLELNTELRFNIVKPVYGAVFVDAGNIWLRNDNPNKPGSTFSKDFLKELAAGAGLGLRIDISLLVLRLDMAFPIRKPFLPETERWVIDQIDFGSSEWRKQNLVFNLAIGYPF